MSTRKGGGALGRKGPKCMGDGQVVFQNPQKKKTERWSSFVSGVGPKPGLTWGWQSVYVEGSSPVHGKSQRVLKKPVP